MSQNRVLRARLKRENKAAIAASIATHHEDQQDNEEAHSRYFNDLYFKLLGEELARGSILRGYDEDGEPFESEEDHRNAILDLGNLWPVEQAEHAETLARLNLT